MAEILDQILAKEYDAIVISPIADAKIAERLRKAADLGIKIIFILSTVQGIPYEALVGTNALKCGMNSGKVVKHLLNNEGEVIIGMWLDYEMATIEERAEEFSKRSN